MAGILTATHWGTYRVETQDGRVARISPFELDSDPSAIGQSLVGALDHPCRVSHPMVRKGWLEKGPVGTGATRGSDVFVPLSWPEAVELVSRELDRVKHVHGNEAIFGGSYGWASAGRFHHAQSQLKRFLNLHGGFTTSVNSYSYGAGGVVVPHLVGREYAEATSCATSWDVVAEHTRLFVMLGGISGKNAQTEAGGLGRHRLRYWLERCRSNGVAFVNLSPVRDDAATELGAEWLPMRPNTDVPLMLGLAHTLVVERLHDRGFLDRYTAGYSRFERYLMGVDDDLPKTANWAADISGVDAETIRKLARRMARTRTMISASWSLQRADHGEQPYWMVATLASMLGQIGLPGGGFGFGYGSMASVGMPGERFSGPAVPQGQNVVKTFIPVARIVELLERPGGTLDYDGATLRLPDIRLIYWAGGNPFHHHQDINRLRRAWARPDTVIVHEQVWNGLAKHADIVLPATFGLERNDLGANTRDSAIFASKQVVPPFGEARNDHDIFADIAERLNFRDAFTKGRTETQWLQWLYEGIRRRYQWLPDFNEFWAQGHVEMPQEISSSHSTVLFDRFRADPVGRPLSTPSGRIEIFSERVSAFGYDDCPGHAVWIEPAEWLGSPVAARYPLHLLSNQPSGRLHSQLDFGRTSQAVKIAGREPIYLHSADAVARGIGTGDIVRVFNDRGQCLAGAVVTDGVLNGVVQMSTGAWYDPVDAARTGSLDANGNVNVLTFDKGSSRLAQGANANSCLVEVELWRGELPPVRAYDPPPIEGREEPPRPTAET